MTDNTPQLQEPTVTLPDSAPLVRVTAGVGSAGQKTWNLRRPVTLIGSSRPAHIVLHDKDISKAHCVIVNTGTDVLVKDLRTSSGTKCNRQPIDIAVLADGDVITIGSNNIQVAINLPEGTAEDTGAGLQYSDPVKFTKPIDVRLMHTEQQWTIEDAVVLIGHHDRATIQLEHKDVSKRHAVIFRFGDRPAVFDLGARSGIWVSGKRTSVSLLDDGDCVTVGPFGLSIGSPDPAALKSKPGGSGDSILQALLPSSMSGLGATADHGSATASPVGATPGASSSSCDGTGAGSQDDSALDAAIGETWQSLNEWTDGAPRSASDNAKRAEALAAKEAELDARDAELRGRLHDVTRMHEQVVEREKKIELMQTELDHTKANLEQEQARITQLESELQQREAEVKSRENALAQRWSRMRSATCVHCGKPTSLTQPPPG